MFALAIYGLVIFSTVSDNAEAEVMDLTEQIHYQANSVPVILLKPSDHLIIVERREKNAL